MSEYPKNIDELAKFDNGYNVIQREKASDQVIHINEDIVRDVPKAPRLCDSLESLQKRYIQIDKYCKLYVEEEGKGEPIVLLNGGPGGTHHEFHPYFSKAADFSRIIYYDQRGCGLSDRNEGQPYSIDQACDDLEKLRKALGIETWTVLGHSYGGLLAQYYAKKYPKSVKGVVLVCATPGLRNLQESPDGKYLSDLECDRIHAIYQDARPAEWQKLYNALLNGDWKRQNFYKPSKEEMARTVLYEWDHDPKMRDHIVNEMNNADLEGVFEGCPIPVLIAEGSHDLTWNTDKVERFRYNHPNADFAIFAESAHSPFKDEMESFFSVLKDFISTLPQKNSDDLPRWIAYIANWEEEKKTSPDNLIESLSFNQDYYKIIAESYTPLWLENMKYPSSFSEAGFALYKTGKYKDALECFKRMEKHSLKSPIETAIALIWQGHMLDLLGRRYEAVAVYEKVKTMDINIEVRHDSLGMSYQPSLYAMERIETPFKN